jgi:hypothetical protein
MGKAGDNSVNETIKHKLERAKAIANEIASLAEVIANNSAIAFPPKRLFRKKGKRPLNRLKRQRALIAMGFAPAMARMQLNIIMAQPIPKFEHGCPAIVGESGPETVGGFQDYPIGEMVHVPIQWQNKSNDTASNNNTDKDQQPADPIRPVPGIDKESDV